VLAEDAGSIYLPQTHPDTQAKGERRGAKGDSAWRKAQSAERVT
jgi:hypothetical protein